MKNCIVCDCPSSSRLYPGVVVCKECGFVFADAELSDEELSALYGEKYFFGDEYSDYPADERTFQKNFRLRLKTLKKFLDPARHRHFLEIGCAYGFFLDLVRREFPHAQVLGFEISDEGTRHAREKLHLDVIREDFYRHDFHDRKFDVVCIWDTMEHLRDPHLYLKKIGEITQPGSLLALTTGDIGSLNARVKGGSWRMIHPPTHLHYFSRQTMKKLLERHGFSIVYDRHCGYYRSMENVLWNMLVLRNNNRRLYTFLRGTGLTHYNFYANMYDIMFVIAKRL